MKALWLCPSSQSYLGFFLQESDLAIAEYQKFFNSGSFAHRIEVVGRNCLHFFAATICTTLDMLWWAGMTVTVIPIFKTGIQNHLTNLVALVTAPVFCCMRLFGYILPVNYLRPFSGKALSLTEQIHLAPHRTPMIVSQHLDQDEEATKQLLTARATRFGNPPWRAALNDLEKGSPALAADLCGIDLNTKDEAGRTALIHAVTMISLDRQEARPFYDLLNATKHPDPRLRIQPVDFQAQDHNGFDALTYALLGVHSTYYEDYDMAENLLEDHEFGRRSISGERYAGYKFSSIWVVEKLIEEGAILREEELRFDEYLTFAQHVAGICQQDPAQFGPAMKLCAEQHKNSPNKFVRLVAMLVLPNICDIRRAFFHRTIVQNAHILIARKNHLIEFARAQRRKRVLSSLQNTAQKMAR